MKKSMLTNLVPLMLVLVAVAGLAFPSRAAAATYDLTVVQSQWSPPDGGPNITMWGFVDGSISCPETGSIPDWDVGPQLRAVAGESLTINLRNCLTEPVSVFITGQNKAIAPAPLPSDPQRMRSFDAETGPGAVRTYNWPALSAGTYLYQSGTSISKQVHMGLYGALIVDAAAATVTEPALAYNGASQVAYDNEVVLVYSEIDPALHNPPTPARPNNYKPRYYLVNGQPYVDGITEPILAGDVNGRILVRMLNATLDDLVPTLVGMHWDLIAEDGHLHPYPKKQFSALLSAMKTRDALIVPNLSGTFAVFDRRLNLSNNGDAPDGAGGMLVQLSVAVAGLTASDDAVTTDEDVPVIIDVLADDPDATAVESFTQPANGSAVLNIDQTITYTPNLNFFGSDAFTYQATDVNGNLSNWATVTVTVANIDDAPLAAPDGYEVPEGGELDVPAPGLLANDSDPDGDPLTAHPSGDLPVGLVLDTDGSFTYGPAGTAGSVVTFDYIARDTTGADSAPATVTISVTQQPANQAPVANPDFATTTRNTAVTINLASNDEDPDGNLDPASVVVSGETGTTALSAKGGTITNLVNGSVVYEPRRNFRGTDTFTYTVSDSGTPQLISNQATVTVNVVR